MHKPHVKKVEFWNILGPPYSAPASSPREYLGHMGNIFLKEMDLWFLHCCLHFFSFPQLSIFLSK